MAEGDEAGARRWIPLPPRSRVPLYDWLQRASRHLEAPPSPWPRLGRERPQREKSPTNRKPPLSEREIRFEKIPPTSHSQSPFGCCAGAHWAGIHETPLFSVLGFHWTMFLSPSYFCLSLAERSVHHMEKQRSLEFIPRMLMEFVNFPLAFIQLPSSTPAGAEGSGSPSLCFLLQNIHPFSEAPRAVCHLRRFCSRRLRDALPCDVTERRGGLSPAIRSCPLF